MARQSLGRWAVVGCDDDAECFLDALRTAKHQTSSDGVALRRRFSSIGSGSQGGPSSASTNGKSRRPSLLPMPAAQDAGHSVSAIAGEGRIDEAQAFWDAVRAKDHKTDAHSNGKSAGETKIVSSATELLQIRNTFDFVFVAGRQSGRSQVARQALGLGKSVLVSNPLSMSLEEAQTLCSEARSNANTCLAFALNAKRTSASEDLHRAANAFARAANEGKAESTELPWTAALYFIEMLDTLRSSGMFHATQSIAEPFPTMERSGARASVGSSPKPRSVSRASEAGDATPRIDPRLREDDRGPRSALQLRTQVQELKHVLRQKTAALNAIEGRNGTVSCDIGVHLERRQGRGSMTPTADDSAANNDGGRASPSYFARQLARADGSQTSPADSTDTFPLGDVSNTSSGTPSQIARRQRKNAGDARARRPPQSPLASPILGLGIDPDVKSPISPLAQKEDSPSSSLPRAQRRMSSRPTQRAASPLTAGHLPNARNTSNGSNTTSDALVDELRVTLESTRDQLRLSQRTITTLQRALGEEQKTLAGVRAELISVKETAARRERQLQDSLERARKAETESRDLGKSSREWGTRVRKIEAELGEERMHKQRIEMQYDALAATWKQTRQAWEKEMKDLRQNEGEAVRRNREDAQRILAKFEAAQEAWTAREAVGGQLSSVLGALEAERKRASTFVEQPVKSLVTQLERHEAKTNKQDAAVEELQAELKRLMRLMRTPAPIS